MHTNDGNQTLDTGRIERIVKQRHNSANKYDFGHALLICASHRMVGAALLACGGALRSGCGLVTVHMPESDSASLFTRFPMAMLSPERAECFSSLPDHMNKYSAIGVGCGIGQDSKSALALCSLLSYCKSTSTPIVIDADAINLIAYNKHLLEFTPSTSIFTPHNGELARLVGEWHDDHEKEMLVNNFVNTYGVVMVVKGAPSRIYFANVHRLTVKRGTPGMAKAGCGDILTGFITGLLARGYSTEDAATLGVYFHAVAGEKAAQHFGVESMNSGDIIDFLNVDANL